MRDFVADTGTGAFTHLVDTDGSLWQRYGVFQQPSFAYIAGDGTVDLHRGGQDEAQLRQAVEELLR
jgi:hypothetical protein